MAVNFPEFIATAGKLYNLWPSFFNWFLSQVAFTYVVLAVITWRITSYIFGLRAENQNATLETRIAALEGEKRLLEQRLAFAREQQLAAKEEAEKFGAELAELKEKMERTAPLAELRNSTATLDNTLGRLLTANNAVTTVLTPNIEMSISPERVYVLPGRHTRP